MKCLESLETCGLQGREPSQCQPEGVYYLKTPDTQREDISDTK